MTNEELFEYCFGDLSKSLDGKDIEEIDIISAITSAYGNFEERAKTRYCEIFNKEPSRTGLLDFNLSELNKCCEVKFENLQKKRC